MNEGLRHIAAFSKSEEFLRAALRALTWETPIHISKVFFDSRLIAEGYKSSGWQCLGCPHHHLARTLSCAEFYLADDSYMKRWKDVVERDSLLVPGPQISPATTPNLKATISREHSIFFTCITSQQNVGIQLLILWRRHRRHPNY